jgi:O-succinylbenzoate synthase
LGINDLAHLAAILTPDETPGLDTLSAFSQDVLIPSGKTQCLTLAQLDLIARNAIAVTPPNDLDLTQDGAI